MNVSAIIVTRGDVNLDLVVASLPEEWEVLIWNNGERRLFRRAFGTLLARIITGHSEGLPDLGAYGRYAAIEYAKHDVIYFQDDDCIVMPDDLERLTESYEPDVLSALMPPSRVDYTDTVLIGWGALFDRHLPEFAFARWTHAGHLAQTHRDFNVIGADFVFPMLTPHKRIDGEHEDLPWAHAPNRTWSLPGYEKTKQWFLREARAVRDGS